MVRVIAPCFLFAVLSTFLPLACSGQIQEGKIIYALTYPESLLNSADSANLPHKCIAYFKDDKLRMDIKIGAAMQSRILTDNKKREEHILFDNNGNKTDLFITEKDKQAEKSVKYEIKNLGEEKVIAGYKCTNALATGTDGKSFIVWYTNEIKIKNTNWNNQFSDIDGFLMEFVMQMGQLTMEMKATSVTAEKIDDAMFDVPAGYKVISSQELKQMTDGK